MKWKDSDGKIYNVPRELARQIDREQGREHMPRDVVQGVKGLSAAISVMKSNDQQMVRWMRKTGALTQYRAAIGNAMSAMRKIVNHGYVEQVCALQGNTTNVWVNVDTLHDGNDSISISHRKGEEYLRVKETDLQRLMCAARGGLTDEHGNAANCHGCAHCFDRVKWQDCELYHLINRIPCYTKQDPQICQDVCPYALARIGADNDGGMQL